MTRTTDFRGRRRGGFTLPELLVTILIAGLIAAFAVPRFVDFVRYLMARSDTSQVVADLTLARTQAVREGQTASFRVVSSTRYTVTVDGGDARTIKTVDLTGRNRNVTLAATGASTAADAGRVAFDSRGMQRTGTANVVVVSNGTRRDTVSITGVGRVYRGSGN